MSRPLLWPADGGFTLLDCDPPLGAATVFAISAADRIIVGQEGGRAALWQPDSCMSALPPLIQGTGASARAVNANGTIVGGVATDSLGPVPVRWILIAGEAQIQQLDGRPGTVFGANALGDLAGYVTVPCSLHEGCKRAVIWYSAGGLRELGTLGGADSWARDINASGDVVGLSTSPHSGNTGYFWSESMGMVQLPVKGQWAAANAVSDVRPDGTRVVVGMNSQGQPVAWVVRNP